MARLTSSWNPFVTRRNSCTALPSCLAALGRRSGPRTMSATRKITRISGAPRLPTMGDATGSACASWRQRSGPLPAGRPPRPVAAHPAAASLPGAQQPRRRWSAAPWQWRPHRRSPPRRRPPLRSRPAILHRGGQPVEPAVPLELEVELEEIVVVDGVTAAGLVQFGGHVPHREADARGDEEVDDARLRRLRHGHAAVGAAERIGALVVGRAHLDGDVPGRKLDIPAGWATRPDRGHPWSPF